MLLLEDETAIIFKTVFTKECSHIVALGYPDYLSVKKGEVQKLGNSSLTIQLKKHKNILLDTSDPSTIAFSRKFLVTDSSINENDKPLQRTIEVLIYPNWEKNSSPKLNEIYAFIERDKEQNRPIVIGLDKFTHAGTYITLRNTIAKNKQVPVAENYLAVGKVLGKEALSNSLEEMASIFAFFGHDFNPENLELLKPFKTQFTHEELAKTILSTDKITPGQLKRLFFEYGQNKAQRAEILKKLSEKCNFSLNDIRFLTLLRKNNIDAKDSAFYKICDDKNKAWGIPKGQFIPEFFDEVIAEYIKQRNEKFAELAKGLYKELNGKALKEKEIQLIDAFSSLEFKDFIQNPDHHDCIKEMLNKKMTVREFNYLMDECSLEFLEHLTEDTKTKVTSQTFDGFSGIDITLLAKDKAAFSDVLQALINAREIAKA